MGGVSTGDYHLVTCTTTVFFLHILRGLQVVKSSNGFVPPGPPGNSGANPNTPRIAFRYRAGRPGCRVFY
jgi:hypothetical protein